MNKWGIAYTDWVAGVTTVEFALWGSFIIGAVASLAAANSSVIWNPPPPDGIPSTSIDQGVLHNALCSNYLAQQGGCGQVVWSKVIDVACQVRPDLAQQIRSLNQSQVQAAVDKALSVDISTPQTQVAYLNSVFNLDPNDLTVVTDVFNKLETIYSQSPDYPIVFEGTVNNLISQVPDFNLSQDKMSGLISSLQILRSSYVLWGGDQW